ncbi:DUF2017 domain-containing protein [Demequina sp. NBRC 110051]|uniref:DUF2017 domain-containing protein n=1 Tax=Demequina sp. NBRC 110051 TaxID=1570340 RepID=UPI000A075F32|nr:DUF2017 domain-containing protein [Demequina sp. NBRC 110051]
MRGFSVTEGAAVAYLDDEESTVIARIVADVGELLGADAFGSPGREDAGDAGQPRGEADALFRSIAGLDDTPAEPADPALRRLLPSASREDDEVAAEFRRLTEGDLRATKAGRLRTMWEQLNAPGEAWEVSLDEAMATASALTDVRLVLAARLSIDTDEDAERLHEEIDLATHAMGTDAHEDLGVDPERVWLGMLYQALTWLQESLLQCLITTEEEQDV